MQGKFNFIGDLQWGSTGKGLAAAYWARRFGVKHVSTTNLPNAGHTAYLNVGDKEFCFVSKIIPTSAILNHIPGYNINCYIGAGAGFFVSRFLQEVEECNLGPGQVFIHPRAAVVTDDHRQMEQSGLYSTKHLASTMQGSAAAVVDKIMRGAEVRLAQDFEELQPYICEDYFAGRVIDEINNGATWLHEGSQGFSLGINHGSHYPFCTSRECTVMQSMSDMGVPPNIVGDVIGVMRPYPIRVGNVVENGQQVGYSGDCYDDHTEISWDEVHRRAGYPSSWNDGAGLSELTTVTKRVRRVFEFSPKQIQTAVKVNGVNKIFLNFANYIDYGVYKKNKLSEMSDKVLDFVEMVNSVSDARVCWLGTGPNIDDVVEIG